MKLKEFEDLDADDQYKWLFNFVRAKIVNDIDNVRTAFVMELINTYIEKHWHERVLLQDMLVDDANYKDIMKIVEMSSK